MIIDSQQYNASLYNNYAYSDIRTWLNENFYDTAFSALQKAVIKTTNVDNSARSTNPDNYAEQWNSGYNSYACDSTQDKVFLLSLQEVTNGAYGFVEDIYSYDLLRQKSVTDYARSQGCTTYTVASYLGTGNWWLRSPYCYDGARAWIIDYEGYTDESLDSCLTCCGVVPALCINFN